MFFIYSLDGKKNVANLDGRKNVDDLKNTLTLRLSQIQTNIEHERLLAREDPLNEVFYMQAIQNLQARADELQSDIETLESLLAKQHGEEEMIYCYIMADKVKMVNTSDKDAVKMHIGEIMAELDSIADVIRYYKEIYSRTYDPEIAKSIEYWENEANGLRANLNELKEYGSSEPDPN